ncbi:hypothetical protein D9M70_645090 [compost metagenome]
MVQMTAGLPQERPLVAQCLKNADKGLSWGDSGFLTETPPTGGRHATANLSWIRRLERGPLEW